MSKKWFKGNWNIEKLDTSISEEFYATRETNSFFDPQDDRECYELRGLGPTCRKIKQPDTDLY